MTAALYNCAHGIIINLTFTCRCKSGKISRCDAPQKFAVNTTSMTHALDDLYTSTVYDGGLTDLQSREEFRKITTLQTKTDVVIFGVARKLADGDYAGVRKTLHLDDLEDSILDKIHRQIEEHPLSVKILIMFAAILLIAAIYMGWTCFRCYEVRQKRHEEDENGEKPKKVSKMNYLWAFLNHNKMDVNINKHNIEKLEAANTKITKQMDVLDARLDSMETVIEIETAVPPPYNETTETV